MYFRKEMKAAYYNSDQNNNLKLSAIMGYMQQTSSEQLASVGQSVERMLSDGMVFILAKTNMKIYRAPACGEVISIGTAATPTIGPRFIREFVVDNSDGERLISCYTSWVLTDIDNHKILRPNAYPYPFRFEEPALEEEVGDIEIPKDPLDRLVVRTMDRDVWYSFLDNNAHVNNSVYADFALDALPYQEFSARGLAVFALNFQKEAKYGDKIEIAAIRLGDGEYKIVGTNAGNPCFEAYVKLGE
ncbi:MAG: thioesterase [Oscillospiraceae bacterium]|nr:thioesterase [Oscillospiraceae bacterium]